MPPSPAVPRRFSLPVHVSCTHRQLQSAACNQHSSCGCWWPGSQLTCRLPPLLQPCAVLTKPSLPLKGDKKKVTRSQGKFYEQLNTAELVDFKCCLETFPCFFSIGNATLYFYLAISKEGLFLATLMVKRYGNNNSLRSSPRDKPRAKSFTLPNHRGVTA